MKEIIQEKFSDEFLYDNFCKQVYGEQPVQDEEINRMFDELTIGNESW